MLLKRQDGSVPTRGDSQYDFGSPPTFPISTSVPDNDNGSGSNDIFGDDDDSDTTNNLVNMYFLILGAFVILLLFGLWYWRRGKRLKRIESLGRRRNALEQDLELGRRRGERSGWLGGMRGRARREEGVDEGGEAPPPYSATTEGTSDGGLVVPPRVHVRDGAPGLPKYEELGRGEGGEEQLARTPEGELVGTRVERELSRDSSTSNPRAEGGMGQELVREPNVISNPRTEEDSGVGATSAISNSATVGVRDVVPGETDRA